ncbi:hypothetical protein SAMN05421770_11911 [Granulicella rosea]|uniref:Outer membrane lipoprotein-sorting protein n=1 Tax=Granulicella rosea TaxID=474952 RepID=A0A239MQJ8_9BACT|nr:hypothetical protein [Granulicella rosea]SNT44402.1 hypothetical protein SAMN05421770_11911 [Granulicella rosea]
MIKMFIALLLTFASIAKAQTSFAFAGNTADAYDRLPMPKSSNRDSQALQLLQQSVDKMGGLTAIRAIPGWKIHLRVTQAANNTTHIARWEVVGDEFRVEHLSSDASKMLKAVTTGQGNASTQSGTTTTPLPFHTVRSWIVPQMAAQLLEKAIDDPEYSLDLLKVDANSNQTIIRIVNTKTPLTRLTTPELWYFDNTTMLPALVCIRQYRPNDFTHHALMTFAMSNFTLRDGVLIPFHSTLQIGEFVLETADVVSVKTNEAIPNSRFAALR